MGSSAAHNEGKGKCKANSEWSRGYDEKGHGNGRRTSAFFTSLFIVPTGLVNSLSVN